MPARRAHRAFRNPCRAGRRSGEVLRTPDRVRGARGRRGLGVPVWDEAMSMMTRCPSCSTVFRVTEQQLGAREGRVRCGRCDTLFDAIATLGPDPVTRPLQEKPSPPTSGSMAVLLGTEKDSSFDFGPPAPRPLSHLWWMGS